MAASCEHEVAQSQSVSVNLLFIAVFIPSKVFLIYSKHVEHMLCFMFLVIIKVGTPVI